MTAPLRRGLLAVVLLGGAGAWLWLVRLEQAYTERPYSLIEERLYAGAWVAEPPPGTTAVLNLCEKDAPRRPEVYLARPIDGSVAPGLDWLREVVAFIDAQRRAGRTTYVHCLAGVNRSGMVVTAYLMYEHGWTRDRALAFVRSKRPQVRPNPTLMRFLAEWERTLQRDEARPP